MKSFVVTAFFPQIRPAHSAWQAVELPAGDIGTAAARALRTIRTREGVKGKRLSEVRLTIKEIDVAASEQ